LFTPDAQCRREMTFRYAVKAYSDNWQTANLLHEALNYKTEPPFGFSEKNGGAAKNSFEKSLISIDSKVIQFSALKRQEAGENVIFRIYNTAEKATEAAIRFHPMIQKIYLSQLSEKRGPEIAVPKGGVLNWTFKPKEIVTFELEF